jgi:hypothetical protein
MIVTVPSPTSPPTNGAPPSDQPAVLVVRRDVRRDLRASMILVGFAVLLVFWVPAVIVLVRPEAAYFTNGILWSALIATILVLLAGAGLTLWWSRRGKVQLTADADGVRIPARRKRPLLEVRWEDLTLVRLVGATDPALAFYLRNLDEEEPADDDATGDALDLSEPEFLRPLDFVSDPPPEMQAPDRATFNQIAPLPEDTEPEETAPTAPRPKPGEVLHATPYVVHLVRTSPPLADILRAITRLSAGRVPLD